MMLFLEYSNNIVQFHVIIPAVPMQNSLLKFQTL